MDTLVGSLVQLLLCAPLLALAACVVVLATSDRRVVSVAAVVLGVVDVVAFATYAYLWGRAFDDIDTRGATSPLIDRAPDVALGVGAASLVAIVGLVVVRLARRGASPSTAQ